LFFRPQNQVLAVAVTAHRSALLAGLHGLPVHALQIGLGNFGMALSTRCRDVEVVDLGTRVLRGQDSVAAVTIRASCGSFVSIHHRSSMNALPIEFDGMCEWNLVPREKLLVAVTSSAGVREIFLGHRGGGIARGLDLMDGSMAGHAFGRIRIACRSRLPVNALPEFLHFIGMTLRALCGRYFGRLSHLVVIAVAGLASVVTERAMHTVWHMGSLVGVASCAFHLRHFGGVRIVLDGRVAVGTAQNAMHAGRMFAGIDRDTLTAA